MILSDAISETAGNIGPAYGNFGRGFAMKYAMPKTFVSALAGTMLLAGSALASDVLSERQLDSVTAGGDITTSQLATAIATFDVTSNANHNVTVTANTYAKVDATVVVDASANGSSTSQSSLNISVINVQ